MAGSSSASVAAPLFSNAKFAAEYGARNLAGRAYLDDVKAKGGFGIECDHGGGHLIPDDIAASAWQFLKAHPFGTKPSPYAAGLPAGAFLARDGRRRAQPEVGAALFDGHERARDGYFSHLFISKKKPRKLCGSPGRVRVEGYYLEIKKVIDDKRIITPTGKFNVENTVNDVY